MTQSNKKGQERDMKNRKKPTGSKSRMKTKVPKTVPKTMAMITTGIFI